MMKKQSAKSTASRQGRRRSLGVWMLVLVLGVMVLGGPAWAGDGQSPPGPQGPPKLPPKAPIDAQICHQNYLANVARCHDIWCTKSVFYYVIWFVDKDCNELYLDQCIANAEVVFDICIAGATGA